MNKRKLIAASLILTGLIILLSAPVSAYTTFALDTGNLTNATYDSANNTILSNAGTASFTVPVLITTDRYAYAYTASKTAISGGSMVYADQTGWSGAASADSISYSVAPGRTDFITGTAQNLFNITVSTTEITDVDYTANTTVQLASSAVQSVSNPSDLSSSTGYANFSFKISTGSWINLISNNTVEPFTTGDGKWSASTKSAIVFNSSTEEREMNIPTLTWGGKTIYVNESLKVEKLSAGVWTEVSGAVINPDGTTAHIPAGGAGAEELRITFTGRMLGDVNGDSKVDVKDNTLIKKYTVEAVTLTTNQALYADVNGDGKVDVKDNTLIKKYTVEAVNEHYR